MKQRKKGQPPILESHSCWEQWGATSENRMAVPFFRPGEAESPLKRARGVVRAGEPALKGPA